MQEALRDIIEDISQGHQGALDIIFKLTTYRRDLVVFDLTLLKQQNIRGADLHYLYVCCNQDIAKLHAVIMKEAGPEMLKSVQGSSFYVGRKEEGILEDA